MNKNNIDFISYNNINSTTEKNEKKNFIFDTNKNTQNYNEGNYKNYDFLKNLKEKITSSKNTKNSINIFNNNGPCIFPITQNINNYSYIMNTNNNINNIPQKEYTIQTQNFNFYNKNFPEKNIINKLENTKNKINLKTININNNKFTDQGKKFEDNLNNNSKINSKFENLNNFNLTNFNDYPIKNKNSENKVHNNFGIFDEKNNFIQDKGITSNINYSVNNSSSNINHQILSFPNSKIL